MEPTTLQLHTAFQTGVALRPSVQGPTYRAARRGEAHYIDCSAILDGDRLHVFATNRSLDQEAVLGVELSDRPIARLDNAEVLTGPDAKAADSFEQPDIVRSRAFDDVKPSANVAMVALPPLSVLAMSLEVGN